MAWEYHHRELPDPSILPTAFAAAAPGARSGLPDVSTVSSNGLHSLWPTLRLREEICSEQCASSSFLPAERQPIPSMDDIQHSSRNSLFGISQGHAADDDMSTSDREAAVPDDISTGRDYVGTRGMQGRVYRPPLPTRGQLVADVARLMRALGDVVRYSLHLLALLVLRVLLQLKTAWPHVRWVLCLVGLKALVTEAERSDSVEKLLRSHMPESLRSQGHLLPPRHERDRHKLTIVLDLDETLVCAYNTEGLPPLLHDAACEGGLQWFTISCSSPEELDENGQAKVHNVTVYQRPGLQEFLAAASQIGEVVLFTAGLEGYARPLVDHIDPEGRISHRLYRPATVSTTIREHVKDLTVLGRDLRRTILIDNNPFSFLLQPLNGIPCLPFTGDDTKDHQLLDHLLPLLEHLDKLSDVRPYLLSRFQMLSWFRTRGVPMDDLVHPVAHSSPLIPMPPTVMQPCTPLQAIPVA